MRDTKSHSVALLVTDDAEVEIAVRHLAATAGDEVRHFSTSREAMSAMIDGCPEQAFAILDLEPQLGGRTLFNTAAGTLPVLAVMRREPPWLEHPRHHGRLGAKITKPVSMDSLANALDRVRAIAAAVGTA